MIDLMGFFFYYHDLGCELMISVGDNVIEPFRGSYDDACYWAVENALLLHAVVWISFKDDTVLVNVRK